MVVKLERGGRYEHELSWEYQWRQSQERAKKLASEKRWLRAGVYRVFSRHACF
jgi:hypothetical protein